MSSYLGGAGDYREEVTIKRSRFITRIVAVDDADDAAAKIAAIKKEHSDATHNCYAYIADEYGLVQRFSDDGEPSGTAGMPMLEVLRKRGAGKTLAVVTRYFGGVKLGASGLVGAYSGCVADALSHAGLKRFVSSDTGEIDVDYPRAAQARKAIENAGGQVTRCDYSDSVKIGFAVPQDRRGKLDEALSADPKNMRLTYTGTCFFGYDTEKTLP